MLQREMGFTFGGQHTSDFGLVWVENRGHQVAPEIVRNEYSIAGKSGTVLLPGSSHKNMEFVGSLFVVNKEPATQREAQQLIRRVVAWLNQGRQRLTFDYEPEWFYLAQVDKPVTWSLANWFGGEMQIRFVAQPYAYSVHPDRAVVETTGTAVTVPIRVHTLHPAPLEVRVENTGTASIDAVNVLNGRIDMQALGLRAGGSLTISMEEPIGAVIMHPDSSRNAMPCAQRFDLVMMTDGMTGIPVALNYAEDGVPGARITVAVRGRW